MIQRTRERFRQTVRWVRRRLQPAAMILLYHRIADVRSDPWALCVTPKHFDEHLHILRQHGTVVRLEHIARNLAESRSLQRAIAITFDDGYADNLLHARPALEKYDLPATVFVVSGALGQAREFWWDELARLLLEPGTLPATLTLRLGDAEQHWDLSPWARYTEADAQRDMGWIAWGDEHPTTRHKMYRALWEKLLPLPEDERQQLLVTLRNWAGAGPEGRASHRTMTPAELPALARDGLVAIGAHTVTHPRLAALARHEQLMEIQQSKARLEELAGQPVQSFSYPFGRRSDYAPETVALVRESGFEYACSNFAEAITSTADRFQLPRVNVPDCDGEAFARYLADEFGIR